MTTGVYRNLEERDSVRVWRAGAGSNEVISLASIDLQLSQPSPPCSKSPNERGHRTQNQTGEERREENRRHCVYERQGEKMPNKKGKKQLKKSRMATSLGEEGN